MGAGFVICITRLAIVLTAICLPTLAIDGEHEKHLLYTSADKRHHHEHHAYNAEHYLLLGSQNGNVGQIKYALERGADINARNNAGVSAIIWAANNGHTEAVKYLIERGASVNDMSNNLRTPLIWACYWGHDKVVEMLLENGANYKVYDEDAMTPLMAAALSGNREIVDMLLDKPGIVITETNHYNATALSIARVHGHPDIVEILEGYFPDELHSDNVYVLLFQVLWADLKLLYQTLRRELRRHAGLPVAEEL